jgi:hypothetical protein
MDSQSIIGSDMQVIEQKSYLYSLFEGKTKYEYDTRIDEYNWTMFYIV